MKHVIALLMTVSIATALASPARASDDRSLIVAFQSLASSIGKSNDDIVQMLKVYQAAYQDQSELKGACARPFTPAFPNQVHAGVFVRPLKNNPQNSYAVDCRVLDASFRAKFSYEQAAVRELYPTPYTLALNYVLRNASEDDGESSAQVQPVVDLFESTFRLFPPFKGLVYRGTSLSDELLARYQPGQIVSDPAFTATSTDEAYVLSHWKSGAEGIWLLEIDSVSCHDIRSMNPRESEVVCAPRTKFQVLERNDNEHVLHLKQVAD